MLEMIQRRPSAFGYGHEWMKSSSPKLKNSRGALAFRKRTHPASTLTMRLHRCNHDFVIGCTSNFETHKPFLHLLPVEHFTFALRRILRTVISRLARWRQASTFYIAAARPLLDLLRSVGRGRLGS
jgi:hypothetical protein